MPVAVTLMPCVLILKEALCVSAIQGFLLMVLYVKVSKAY